MSLENALTDLAAAIREQTERVTAMAGAPKPAAAAAPAARPTAKPAAVATKTAPAAKADAIPYTKVQEAVAALANAKGKPAVKEVLTAMGVGHAKELATEQYADAISKLEAAASDEPGGEEEESLA